MLSAFPDRVARQRPGDRRTVVLAAGGSAALGFEPSAEWMVAVDVAKREGGTRTGGVEIRLAANIEPEWLLDLYPDRITDVDRRAFNPDTGWVERTTGLAYGALMLEQTTEPAPPDDETAVLLAQAALARGYERLPGGEGLAELAHRLAFARNAAPNADLPAEADVEIPGLIRAACLGRRSLSELDDLLELALAALPPRTRQTLETMAPSRITLAGGRSVPVHYGPSAPPWIESRLQDFFGTTAAPTIAAGRVPLTLHLLAPNGRAVQVTSDLSRFWREHYPALRRELGRRYPKHAWPEDGATARPPTPSPGRRR
jgi:ATP-dependent helicase HrpB